MPGPLVQYSAISSSPEDQTSHPSDAHEAGNLSPTDEWIRAETLTKWTYLFLGCATLLPWNALINASPFFLSRLTGSSLYPIFNPYLSSVYTLTNLVCQLYCTVTSKQSSPSRRTFASIVGQILVLASLWLSTFAQGTPSTFFSFALFSGAASAISAGYLCTAVYATAPLFGVSLLQTLMGGQAAVAVAVSAVQVASTMLSLWGSSPKSVTMEMTRIDVKINPAEDVSTRIFFGVSVIFLVITLVAYTWLARQPFYKSVTNALERPNEARDAEEHTRLVADGRDREDPAAKSRSHIYPVLKQNWTFMFSLAYVFAITLASSVYPATTVRVQPVNSDIHPLLFTAFHFLLYNTGDLVGRYTCSFPSLAVWSANKILAMALLRTLFVPLILLCNVHRPATIPSVSPFINSDILYMVILLAMGYSNGYVSTRATLAAASLEHNPGLKGRREDVDVASTLSSFFVVVGLAVGALTSFAVEAMRG